MTLFSAPTLLYPSVNVVSFRPRPSSASSGQSSVRLELDDLSRKLEDLIRLPLGWDGYSGTHVRFDIASFTMEVVKNACTAGMLLPTVVPCADGTVQLEWHTLLGDLEVAIHAPNRITAWLAFVDGETGEEEIELANDMRPLTEMIRRISNNLERHRDAFRPAA